MARFTDLSELKAFLENSGVKVTDSRPQKEISIVQFGNAPAEFLGSTPKTNWFAITCDRKIKAVLPQLLARFDGYICRVIVHSESPYIFMEIYTRQDFKIWKEFDQLIHSTAWNDKEREFKTMFKFRRLIDQNEIKPWIQQAVAM